jgi:hypothetical protein
MGYENLKDVSAIASTASAGISPIASLMGKQNAADAAMATAQQEAGYMRLDAADAALKEQQSAKKVRSAQLAAFLKSGVTLEGSPLLVANETTETGQKNANTIIANANRKAQALINKADSVDRGDIFGTAATSLAGVSKGLEYFSPEKSKTSEGS